MQYTQVQTTACSSAVGATYHLCNNDKMFLVGSGQEDTSCSGSRRTNWRFSLIVGVLISHLSFITPMFLPL